VLSTEPVQRRAVAVALVYQSEALNAHVREAMTELGARVVFESSVLAYRAAELNGSSAEVVIVNLDPSSDEDLGAIDDLLIDHTRRVVFNDGEATARLSGWDLARWARHLAAKVLGETVGLPPAPIGSERIPQAGLQRAAELSTPTRPRGMEPTTPIGTNAEAEHAADEMTRALAGFSMAQAEVSEQSVAHDELSASLAGLGLGDFASLSSPPAPAPAAPLNAEPSATVSPIEPAFDLPDFGMSAIEEPTPAVKVGEAKSIFEELGLGLDLGSPAPAVSAPNPESTELDNPFSGLDIDFDSFDAAPPARDEPQGLDALLATLPKEPVAEKSAPAPRTDRSTAPTLELPAIPVAAVAKATASQPPADNPFAGLSLELAPLDGAAPAPAAPIERATNTSAPGRDFSSALAGLSLEPLEGESSGPLFGLAPKVPAAEAAAPAPTVAPIPSARTPVAAAPVDDNPFADLSLSLESIDGDLAPVAMAAASGPPPIDDDNPFADFDLGLDLNTDSHAPPAIPTLERESAADGASEDDFMRELAALGALSDRVAGSVDHVVLLGASIGGPDAVREFLGGIQASSGSVFVLAQHMGADFVDLMAQQLQRATRLNVVMPKSGDIAKAGDVVIVPVAERLLLEPDGQVRLLVPDQVSPYSPSIDQALCDLADRFGDKAMAIIFSGMAHDAIEGAKYLASRGGRIWVQDPATCVVSSMIDGAVEAGVVSFIGSPTDLAEQFNREFK